MTSLLVTGYKSFELGIFKDKDPKVTIIKKAIKRDFKRFLDDGVDWMIFTGNLGFEFWALEVAKELQQDYPLKLATLFPFETHGQNWNEANQTKLAAFKQKLILSSIAFPLTNLQLSLNNLISFSLIIRIKLIYFMNLKMKQI